MQRFHVVLRGGRQTVRLERRHAALLGAGVEAALEVQHRAPVRRWRRIARADTVPLDELVGRRIGPEVVGSFGARVVERTGPNEQRAQYRTVVRIGDE